MTHKPVPQQELPRLSNFDEFCVPVCVHEAFRTRAAEKPDAVALRSVAGEMTYRQLDERSDQFAHTLSEHNVEAGTCVGLCMARSHELVIALLGILKAGAGYVPLVPNYPQERIDFILRDTNVAVVVVDQVTDVVTSFPASVSKLFVPPLGASNRPMLAVASHPDDRAYVMYTSGSTGMPKGVEVPHRAIERLTGNPHCMRLGEGEVVLHAAPIAFDASTIEVWGTLLSGGCVALYPEALPTAEGLKLAIERFGVTSLWLTAALFNMIVDQDPKNLEGVHCLVTGGEALSVAHIKRAQAALPQLELFNGYGPTETTTFATCFRIPRPVPDEWTSIPIGSAIRQTRLYCLSSEGKFVEPGEVGELYIGGFGLALGYLNRPDLTASAFVADPVVEGTRVYRTGDLVRVLPSGDLDYVGRSDQQVKIRGFRIEPGEIEHHLNSLRGVLSSAVTVRTNQLGEKRLVAYWVPAEGGARPEAGQLREALSERLPEYMIPASFVQLASLPLTPNGKLDQRALPPPSQERPELRVPYAAPSGAEVGVAAIFSEILEIFPVGVDDNFFEMGGTSLLAVRAAALLKQSGHENAVPIRLFEFPTVRTLTKSLGEVNAPSTFATFFRDAKSTWQSESCDVAIIGMAGRFPGSDTVAHFWQSLLDGREGIARFKREELDLSIPDEEKNDPLYVAARGVLNGVEQFDAAFFGVSPMEADLMDPQQRVLMEVSWEALEDGGYVPANTSDRIGIFAGKYNNTYFTKIVSGHPELVNRFGEFNTMLANEKDYVATRTAYALNLTGPAVSIHTACSTSLVCIVQAVEALRKGSCELALAGGVAITVPVKSGHLYQEGTMLSRDGSTRSFSDQASGTVFSDGAAMLLLKRLPDAIKDGDNVYAVVRGVATNNDGGGKASFTAPSVQGQSKVIAAALRDAGVSPRDVSYVEAHGTATPLGDPVEFEALRQVFSATDSATGWCGLGSVKSNIGHCVIAAGAAGVIKTALSLRSGVIPASLGFERPSPALCLEQSPFFITSQTTAWKAQGERRLAGVSSFGVGGTNAHVILQEPPPTQGCANGREAQLLLVSARTEKSLAETAARLADACQMMTTAELADVAYTLHVGRQAFPVRSSVVADSGSEAQNRFSTLRHKVVARKDPKVVLLFPGQGSQFPHMGATLYRQQSTFRRLVDECAEILRPQLGAHLMEIISPTAGDDASATEALSRTAVTQPALFVIEYCLARLWEAWGVQPFATIGHSVGEFVSATLSGVMRLEDALSLVAHRGRLMQEQAPGAMLSVRVEGSAMEKRLLGRLCIASHNSPNLCVVSGPTDEIEQLRIVLDSESIPNRVLLTSHAFHSEMMAPVTAPFQAFVSALVLQPPQVPFISTATGTWIRPEEATDPAYWANHLRLPVRFSEGLQVLLKEPHLVLLEVGPRRVLTTLVQQHPLGKGQNVYASLGNSDEQSWTSLLGSAGRLWEHGVELKPSALHGPEQRRRVSLPTYAFDRQRHWLDPKTEAPPPSPIVQLPHPVETDSAAQSQHMPASRSSVIDQQLSVMKQQVDLMRNRREAGPPEEN